MSEAPGPALGPETTLETAVDPAQVTDRREGLAAALEALDTEPSGENPAQSNQIQPNPEPSGENPADSAPAPVATPEPWEAPPTSWKKDYHDMYKTLPPEARQYIFQREDEMRRGIEQVIPKAKFADEIERIAQPYQANLQAAGVPLPGAIQALMQADNILRTAPPEQKRAYAYQLLQQYGVDLGDGSYQPEPVDPTIMALRNEITETRGLVMTWQQQQQQAQEQAMQSEIGAFAAQHEHFETLRPKMAQLMTAGLAENLEQAYQQALRLDENLFSAQQASSQAAAEAARRAAADKAAKAARAAAVSTKTSTPGGASATKATDRRSLLSAQLSEVGERL